MGRTPMHWVSFAPPEHADERSSARDPLSRVLKWELSLFMTQRLLYFIIRLYIYHMHSIDFSFGRVC